MKKSFVIGFLILLVLVNFVHAGEISVTGEHPFLIVRCLSFVDSSSAYKQPPTTNHNQQQPTNCQSMWVSAKNLRNGDLIRTLNGRYEAITRIEKKDLDKSVKVYNLEAGIYHNFIVGLEDLIVHNSNLNDKFYFTRERARKAGFSDRFLDSPNDIDTSKTNLQVFDEAHNIKSSDAGDPRALQQKYNFLTEMGYTKTTIKKLFDFNVCGFIEPGKGFGGSYIGLKGMTLGIKTINNKVELEIRNGNLLYRDGKPVQGVIINGEYIEFVGYQFTDSEAAKDIINSGEFLRKNALDPYVYFAEPWGYCQMTQNEIKHILGARAASDYIIVKIRYPLDKVLIKVESGKPAKFAIDGDVSSYDILKRKGKFFDHGIITE